MNTTTAPSQHHINFAEFLKTLGRVSQVLAAVAPLVVAPLATAGTIDPQMAQVINQEASVASQILAQVVPSQEPPQ